MDSEQLENILQNFRMEDLKKLMEAIKKPKSGTKPVLMSRAIEAINSSPRPAGLERKIKALYKRIPIKGWFPTKQNPHYDAFMKKFWADRDALLAAPSRPSSSSSKKVTGPKADAPKKPNTNKTVTKKPATGPKAKGASSKTVTMATVMEESSK